ncbi:MAG TPA: hypothetical protein VNV43_11425, partial [Candidatus Acidoferrales bacterium]|nr:hypothetical protein [Candidatus Acidoferrales bacterium]
PLTRGLGGSTRRTTYISKALFVLDTNFDVITRPQNMGKAAPAGTVAITAFYAIIKSHADRKYLKIAVLNICIMAP